MTLRVLFSDSSRGWSGLQKWMVLSAKEFTRRGWQTIATGRPDNEFVGRANDAGVETVAWPFASDFDPRTITAALGLMHRRRIDLVVAVAPRDIRTVGMAAWLSRRPVVFRMDRPESRYGITHRVTARRIVTRAIVSSEDALRTFQPFPWFAGKIRVVPHGIGGISPTTAAAKSEARGRLGWNPNDFIILYVGRLRDVKGCDVLIDAFASCVPNQPRARLVFVGTGLEEERLRSQVHDLNLEPRVHFAGYQRELSDYYDACDLFVLPSRKEAFGYVLLEAMVREKPVIASRTGGIPEVVGADAALLVPPDDPRALAEAMDTVLRDDALRTRLEQAGGERVRSAFPESRMYNRTEEIFREAVAVRRRDEHRQGGADTVSATENPGKVATP